jgi:hypothetical protein
MRLPPVCSSPCCTDVLYSGILVVACWPAVAALIAGSRGNTPVASYTQLYGATEIYRSLFPLFLLGAIFGIAYGGFRYADVAGQCDCSAPSVRVELCWRGVLMRDQTYGGVSLLSWPLPWYPVAAALFRQPISQTAEPRLHALVPLLYMTALPGTPPCRAIPACILANYAVCAPGLGILTD